MSEQSSIEPKLKTVTITIKKCHLCQKNVDWHYWHKKYDKICLECFTLLDENEQAITKYTVQSLKDISNTFEKIKL